DACEIIHPGKNHDGWWTNNKFVEQVKHAIQIFKHIYSDAVAKFVFDQSSAHGAFVKNTLNTKEMNIRPGGKQRKMHNICIPMDNPNPALHGMQQAMVFPTDLPTGHPDFEFQGQPKGIYHVLEECSLLSVLQEANGGKVVGECQTCKLSCEAQEQMLHEAQMLANQQDFMNEKPLIQIIIEGAGHKCWFLPKFHCELNPIEMYWGWMKARECCSKQMFQLLIK
ncbi:hypothetical protein SCLCIDRAFT_107611, partial [Scleroderma citrinum Foug A]